MASDTCFEVGMIVVAMRVVATVGVGMVTVLAMVLAVPWVVGSPQTFISNSDSFFYV